MGLKELRKNRGMSQGKLAEATGISARRISSWERGERSINRASLALCVKLADALGVDDLRELMDDDRG
jgi:transcriptional regulator with XRE-family HTH domain